MSEEEVIGLVLSLAGCAALILIMGFSVLVWWRIFSKAGYSGALGLLILIPVVNLIAVCVLAFAQWPLEQEVKRLRAATGESGFSGH